MTKVSFLWRMATVFVVGMILGLVVAYTTLSKMTNSNEGQNITIGNLKIKNSSDVSKIYDLDQDSEKTDSSSKKGLFKNKK